MTARVGAAPTEERIRAVVRGRRVLVTGATGLVGAPLHARLAALDCAVTGAGYTRVPPAGPLVGVDLRDPAATLELVRTHRPDLVLHLAAVSSQRSSLRDPVRTLSANITATVNLLDAVRRHAPAATVLVASSTEVADAAAHTPYLASKRGVEAVAAAYRASYDLRVVVARLAHVYGPADPDPDRLVPYLLRMARDGGVPALREPGRVVDLLHVDDAVDGLLLALSDPPPAGGYRELSSGTGVRVADLSELVTGAATGVPPAPVAVAGHHVAAWPVDWTPVTDLRTGIGGLLAHAGPAETA